MCVVQVIVYGEYADGSCRECMGIVGVLVVPYDVVCVPVPMGNWFAA